MPQSPRWGTSRTCSNQNYPRCSPLAHPRGPPHLSPKSRGGAGRDLLRRLPEVPRVGEAAVALWQFLQHVHELGEGGALLLLVGPAEEQDVLQPHGASA